MDQLRDNRDAIVTVWSPRRNIILGGPHGNWPCDDIFGFVLPEGDIGLEGLARILQLIQYVRRS